MEIPSLEQLWAIEGIWNDVDVDPRTWDMYGLRNAAWDTRTLEWTAEVCHIKGSGIVERVTVLTGKSSSPTGVRVCRLSENEVPGFVVWNRWGETVHVFGGDGELRWKWRAPTRNINSVRIGDLDGDGVDEVVIGTDKHGVLAFDAAGAQRWQALPGHYGHVVDVVAPADSEGRPWIAVEHAWISILDGAGQVVKRIRPDIGFRHGAVRTTALGQYELIGATSGPVRLQAISIDGARRLDVRDDDPQLRRWFMSSLAVSRDGRWVAVTMKDGRLLVYDAEDGRRVGTKTPDTGVYPKIAWTRGPDGPGNVLVQASFRGLRAFIFSAPHELR